MEIRAVSYSSSTAVLASVLSGSFLQAAFKSLTIGRLGLISKILLPLVNSKLDVSPSVCAFMSLSMLADQPTLPDTTHGEELRRFDIWTFATLSPSCCFTQSHRIVYSCLVSFSLRLHHPIPDPQK
uniref:Uncharacterized protein n=1 Tax=Arundo donax TaxID=35708 RepID=A0A0A9EYN7_ARUDO